jgi:hypothetical protein
MGVDVARRPLSTKSDLDSMLLSSALELSIILSSCSREEESISEYSDSSDIASELPPNLCRNVRIKENHLKSRIHESGDLLSKNGMNPKPNV